MDARAPSFVFEGGAQLLNLINRVTRKKCAIWPWDIGRGSSIWGHMLSLRHARTGCVATLRAA